MFNKKVFLIGLIVILFAGAGIGLFKWNNSRPSTQRKKVAENIKSYYESKPRVADAANVEKANAALDKAPEGSFCERAGYPYQVTNSEGGVVCTPGYH